MSTAELGKMVSELGENLPVAAGSRSESHPFRVPPSLGSHAWTLGLADDVMNIPPHGCPRMVLGCSITDSPVPPVGSRALQHQRSCDADVGHSTTYDPVPAPPSPLPSTISGDGHQCMMLQRCPCPDIHGHAGSNRFDVFRPARCLHHPSGLSRDSQASGHFRLRADTSCR